MNAVSLQEKLAGLQCPRCGEYDSFIIRPVQRSEFRDGNSITVTLMLGVCSNCGEEIFDDVASRKLSEAIRRLTQHDFTHLQPTGQAYLAD